MSTTFTTVDDYVNSCPADVQPILNTMRSTILEVIPEATEGIRYSMPTFLLNGNSVVHFAAWKKHVSIYPAPSGDAAPAQVPGRWLRLGACMALLPFRPW